MDIEHAKNRVAHILAVSGDPEFAHGLEDDLYTEFVSYLAGLEIEGVSDVAREIVKTLDFDFPRYTV